MKKVQEDIVATPVQTPIETEVVSSVPFTSSKTIQNGLTFYEVFAPVNGKAKLEVTNRLNGINQTVKLIDLTEVEFSNEELLKAKFIK